MFLYSCLYVNTGFKRRKGRLAPATLSIPALELRGFPRILVKEGAGVRDGGVDVTLVRGNETLLVQCKHWKSSAVGVVVVRELAGVVQLNRATGGVLVCSGRYTREAEVEAMQLGIHLLTGDDLLKHIQVLAA